MRTIRKHVFETNSSSCHSLTFSPTGNMYEKPAKLCLIAERGFCGSNNYGYDDDYNYSYDMGEDLDTPQDKLEYLMVNLVEYFNRRALLEDRFNYYKNNTHKLAGLPGSEKVNLKADYIYQTNIHYVDLPKVVYDELCNLYKETVNGIKKAFEDNGIEIISKMPEPEPLETYNDGSGYNDLIKIEGYIDHDSSCSQHEQAPWSVAEKIVKRPSNIYDFVMDTGNIITICYQG